jgi:hypothetical protein
MAWFRSLAAHGVKSLKRDCIRPTQRPKRAPCGTGATLCGVNFDAGTLISGFFISGVGFVFFNYGRKMGRPIHLITGLILMVFPYFVPHVLASIGIAAALCGLNYLAVQRGY